MNCGFVSVLKPSGMNSNYAVVGVRRLFEKGTKVGHMGTLDPAAAGVLPIGVGFAARLFDYVVDKEKEYLFELTLGLTTDTQDAEGRVLTRAAVRVGPEEVRAVLPRFTGTILQTPPAYSAIVKNGQKLYAIARAGGDTAVEQRPVQVHSLELVDRLEGNKYLLRVRCGRGFYVRTLCHDIGQALGCGGICSFLLRTRAGVFDLAVSTPMEDLAQSAPPVLLPADLPLAHMPLIPIPFSLFPKVRNGAPLRWSDIPEVQPVKEAEPVRVYIKEQFVGIGRREGASLRFLSLMPPKEMDDAVL